MHKQMTTFLRKASLLLVGILSFGCAWTNADLEGQNRTRIEPWYFIRASELEISGGNAERFRTEANQRLHDGVNRMPTGNAQRMYIQRAAPQTASAYMRVLSEEVLLNKKSEFENSKKKSSLLLNKDWTDCEVLLNQAGYKDGDPARQESFMVQCMNGRGW